MTRSEKDPKPRSLATVLPFYAYALLFLGVFSIYLLFLYPAFPNDDSAETVTAAVTLGLQHPPGYALAALWGRCWSLLPIGSPCWRLNLGSAFLAAFCVAILAFLVQHTLSLSKIVKSGHPLAAAPMGALFLAISSTYWEKALGAKGSLYLLTLLLSSLLWACLLGHEKGPGRRPWLLLAFFLFGLGFAGHWETHLLSLPLLAAFFIGDPSGKVFHRYRLKPFLTGLSLLVLGVSPLLYLPLRAHLHPVLNWGAPDSLHNFLADLSRSYTSGREAGLLGTFAQCLTGQAPWSQWTGLFHSILDLQGRGILRHLWQASGPALILVLVGLAWSLRYGSRRILLVLSLPPTLLVLSFLSAAWIPPGPMASWYLDSFLILLDWTVVFLAAIGLHALMPLYKRGFYFGLGVLALALALGLGRMMKLDPARGTQPYDYGVNLLRSLPTGSVFFAESDEDYFSLGYLQGVGGLRPDLRCVTTFTLFETWGVEQVKRFQPELGLTLDPRAHADPYHRIGAALAEIMAKGGQRGPCGFSYFNGAFHRYYLAQVADQVFRRSGNLLLFDSSLPAGTPVLGPGGLRLRHWEGPSSQHPSLAGIRETYRSAGVFP